MGPRLEPGARPFGPVVQGFRGRGFIVDGVYHDAVLLTPERAIAWDAPPAAALTVAHLEPLLALDPTPLFLLFGSGARIGRPPKPVMDALGDLEIGVEAMDSRAAARTWGVLRAEERWFAAALLPLDA